MTPTVFSIIVNVYNIEDYVEACIDSIMSQMKTDAELIVVDDGSTDSSWPRIQKCASRINKARTLVTANRGLLQARQVGIDASSGDYVIFVDGDDFWFSGYLDAIRDKVRMSSPDVVISSLRRVDTFGKPRSDLDLPISLPGDAPISRQVLQELLAEGRLNSLVTKTIRRQLLTARWEEPQFQHLSFGEDLLRVLPILTRSRRTVYSERACYAYRMQPKSLSHEPPSEKRMRDALLVANALMEYTESSGDWPTETRAKLSSYLIGNLINLVGQSYPQYELVRHHVDSIANSAATLDAGVGSIRSGVLWQPRLWLKWFLIQRRHYSWLNRVLAFERWLKSMLDEAALRSAL